MPSQGNKVSVPWPMVWAGQLHLPTMTRLCPPKGIEWAFPGLWFGQGNCTYLQCPPKGIEWAPLAYGLGRAIAPTNNAQIMPSQGNRVGVPWPMVWAGQLHLPTVTRLCPPKGIEWAFPWPMVCAGQLHISTMTRLCPPKGIEWAFPGLWFGQGNCNYQQCPPKGIDWAFPGLMVWAGQLQLPTMPSQGNRVGVPWPNGVGRAIAPTNNALPQEIEWAFPWRNGVGGEFLTVQQ